MALQKTRGNRFEFSLQRLLDVRRHQTREAQVELSSITEERSYQESLIAQARQSLLHRASSESIIGQQGARFLLKRSEFQLDSLSKLSSEEDKLMNLQNLEDERRKKLVAARQSEETLNTLYEKEEVTFVKDRQNTEFRDQDEQALMVYARRSQSPHK